MGSLQPVVLGSSMCAKALGTGLGDLQGCGCALHPGGVETAELCPEGPVQGCDVRELQQPGLAGTLGIQTRCVFSPGKGRQMRVRGCSRRLCSWRDYNDHE